MENMYTDVEVLRVKFAWKLFVVGLKLVNLWPKQKNQN